MDITGKRISDFKRVSLYRRGKNRNELVDKSSYFGELIVLDTPFGKREIITGNYIPVVQEIFDEQVDNSMRFIKPNYLAIENENDIVSKQEIDFYLIINNNDNFKDSLNSYINETKKNSLIRKLRNK